MLTPEQEAARRKLNRQARIRFAVICLLMPVIASYGAISVANFLIEEFGLNGLFPWIIHGCLLTVEGVVVVTLILVVREYGDAKYQNGELTGQIRTQKVARQIDA